jgi:pyridoxamine 5'-phosphate oxidase
MINDVTYSEAVARFRDWLDQASRLDLRNPTAMSLATCTAVGQPSVRMVLMRGFDERGIVFFTNSESQKGIELAENPRAALCFYWESLGKQIRVEGAVEKATDEESDAYWQSRPRDSQLSAWASQQSRELESREVYDAKVVEMIERFGEGEVPRPEHWYGYRVVPWRIEFWTESRHRMHDREVYEQSGDGWKTFLLDP